MSAIQQNADGTYDKVYSDTELYIINSLANEVKSRISGDQLLWVDVTGLGNRVKALEDKDVSIDNIQAELTNAIRKIQSNADEITRLDGLLGVDAYSKKEMDRYVISWKVEQIPHRFATPTNEMFDKIDIDDLQSGYVSYLNADINEPHDNHIPENIMRRYTISAYVETPREVTFHIHYADRLNVYLNGVSEAIYTDTQGNFGSVRKILPLMLKEGWNKFQFLISNETQRGGLVFESDLYEKADYLSNLDDLSGMITGDRIQAGTLDETHFSPNMDLVVNTLTATADNVPGVMIGDPNGCGILQIGDKTITKCINEPFVFDDGIRVNGYIYVSQLLIDVDFILQGDGILIDKIKDAATGFTRAYVIHNDLRVLNGGGLTIVGDGRKGFTFTNAMKLIGDQKLGGMNINPEPNESGLDISGDAVKGYYIRNAMLMTVEGTGGLLITGNPQTGYFIKNTMNLSAYKGIKVEGDPSTAAGYVLKNQMGMTGDGVKVTPTPLNTDYIYNWHIENDTKIDVGFGLDVSKVKAGHFKIWNILEVTGDGIGVTSTGNKNAGFSKHHLTNNTSITPSCLTGAGGVQTGGGISVVKDGNGAFRIGNAMKLTLANTDGPLILTGDACNGYVIRSMWPVLQSGAGIRIQNMIPGYYHINNEGVLGISSGAGIALEGSQQNPIIRNTGVLGINGGEGISIEGSMQQPTIKSNVNVVAGSPNVSVMKSGSTFVVAVSEPDIPPPVIEPPPYEPPPTGGGGGGNPGTGSLSYSGGVSSGRLPKHASAGGNPGPYGSTYNGLASGSFAFNDDGSLTVSISVWHGGNTAGKVYIFAVPSFGSTNFKDSVSRMLSMSNTSSNRVTVSKTFSKSVIGSNSFYVAVGVDTYAHQEDDIYISITNPGQFS